MQRFLWWIAFGIFIAVIVLGIFLFSLVIAAHPEAAAFVIGFLGSWLFANRLIFGYGGIANSAKAFLDGEVPDKSEIAQKVAKSQEAVQLQKLEDLSVAALLSMWLSSLEPFKYAYYIGFFLVFLISILFKLNILSSLVVGPVAEAVTLGAAIPTLLVWGLELLASYYVGQALAKAVKEAEEKTSKSGSENDQESQ